VGARGAGVVELIQTMIDSDLRELGPRLVRHRILLGTRADGTEVRVEPYGTSMLVAGASGSGKSTLAVAMLERLAEHGYQFCVVDPEGDYESVAGAVVLGARDRPPVIDELLELFEKPTQNVVVNLVGVAFEDRPQFFATLLSRIQELRGRSGRPHWLIIDEAHHVLPASWDAAALPQSLDRAMLVTLHPNHLARVALTSTDLIITVGESAQSTIGDFAGARGVAPPTLPEKIAAEELVAWTVGEAVAIPFRVIPSRAEHRRHRRKYAQGQLGEDASFYFRGAEGKLNLRAPNLITFVQLAAGVDDETWLYHLRHGDYSAWFRAAIKDEDLAEEAAAIERAGLSTDESRARIRAAIEERYTLPA
jgi:hypothetical protein